MIADSVERDPTTILLLAHEGTPMSSTSVRCSISRRCVASGSQQHAVIRMVPSRGFDLTGAPVVADVVDAVAARGLVLIGWRRHDPGRTVTINPHLEDGVELVPGDELIVIGGGRLGVARPNRATLLVRSATGARCATVA